MSFNYTNNAKIYLNDIEKQKYYPIHFINGDLQSNHNIILGIENPDKKKTENLWVPVYCGFYLFKPK